MKKIIVLEIIALLLLVQSVAAETLTIKQTRLPEETFGAGCAEDSSTHLIYCFGGFDGNSNPNNRIDEYNPATDTLSTKPTALPTAKSHLACAEDSSTHLIYCFGGLDGSNNLNDEILEYNPSTNIITQKRTLPLAKAALDCAEDSSTHLIYCFGGGTGGGSSSDEIIQYNPSTNTVISKSAKLPSRRSSLSCVENSLTNLIYCFGGETPISGSYTDQIVEYNPSTDVLVTKSAILPEPTTGLGCEGKFKGSKIYCFGGQSSSGKKSYIYEYTPATDMYIQRSPTFSTSRYYVSCVEDSSTHLIYCFGGLVTDEIVEYMNSLPPILSPIGNQVIKENATLLIQLNATDPEGVPLAFSTNANLILPSPYSFNTTTGLFLWTPATGDEGNYTVTFSVSDGGLTANETIIITVTELNLPPTFNPIGNKQTIENQQLSFILTATDPNNDPLVFDTNAASVLYTPFSFDQQTGLFTWNPSFVDAGTYDVSFNVTDGEFADEETITITVLDAKTARLAMAGAPQIGNTVQFLVSDPVAANQFYIFMFSLGNSTGFSLGGGRTVPLDPDGVFFTSLQFPIALGLTNSIGILNTAGNGIVTWGVPNMPTLNGLTMYAAFVSVDLSQLGKRAYISISNPVQFTITI